LCTTSLFFAKALRLKEKADHRDDPGSGIKEKSQSLLKVLEISLQDLVNKRKNPFLLLYHLNTQSVISEI
jgi:hypothetical protein